MFLKEALQRCSQLQQETASQYDALCAESPRDDGRAAAWRAAAARERRRAEFLGALALLCAALEDEGPFLVQIPLQLEEFRRALDSVEWRRDTSASQSGCACAELLERIPGGGLYADLVELAEPEVRRALHRIGNEIRTARRSGDDTAPRRDANAPRRNGKATAACVS